MIERSDTEEVDALVVLEPPPDAHLIARRSSAPVAQTAAAAAGGLLVGAVIARLLGRHRRAAISGRSRWGIRARRQPERGLSEIVASRSLLVDVHLLGASSRGTR